MTMTDPPLFTAFNLHSTDCGAPPQFLQDQGKNYHGYFENKYGEQWVFVYDHEANCGSMRGGDVGWERVVEIGPDGRLPENLPILGTEEKQWLLACLQSAIARRSR